MENIDNKKKRGRRKKIDTESSEPIIPDINNIQIEIQEVTPEGSDKESDIDINITPKKKIPEEESPIESKEYNNIKKRGRKPKGGKLIYKQPEQNNTPSSIANIILHLKCSLNDLNEYNHKISKLVTNPLEYNPSIPPDILTYNGESQAFSEYLNNETVFNETPVETKDHAYQETKRNNYVCSLCKSNSQTWDSMEQNSVNNGNIDETEKEQENEKEKEKYQENDEDINIKDINYKLKKLKINLYKNNQCDKKSACFWCTYEYDNAACYIPKYDMDDKLYGYGSFCRPECAVAYLMKENIDDSTKFERYHLLNQIYSKVYDFKKNIKPAPNPYYLLDKFYGNLSIQEYRKLLKTEHMLLVIDKPMTRILPELHEDNDDLMMNIYGTGNRILNGLVSNTSGVYKVKRQSDKQVGPSKTSIIRDTFGMT